VVVQLTVPQEVNMAFVVHPKVLAFLTHIVMAATAVVPAVLRAFVAVTKSSQIFFKLLSI